MTERSDKLEESIQKVRARRSIPIENWLMIAGGALVFAGILLIILGWVGASRTPYVFEQVPYLISGGLLGVALAIVGGLAYFAYWMTQQVRSSAEQSEATRQALGRIEELLAAGAGAATNGTHPAGSAKGTNGKRFVITGKGTMFHRPDCVVVAGKPGTKAVAGTEKGLVPCKICDPLAVSA